MLSFAGILLEPTILSGDCFVSFLLLNNIPVVFHILCCISSREIVLVVSGEKVTYYFSHTVRWIDTGLGGSVGCASDR